ncbi:PE-PGRS family protein [Streptomyces sp. AM8-1-1]|uniref:PE-PGRS family protein n=1 Tax=Streptomyces sp. AM8-1-1 TaxID=3075825 RepID=UPI0028C4A4F2|nr:PE-PGRS family protein [Streptomyces sp. AM8-1-1]WNO76344.1 PE-PGRS family protein [Streptomyces sp. AM8-1-1]
MNAGGDEYAQLLTRAGLEIVGDGRGDDVLPTWVAMRPVVAGNAEPTVAVRHDRPDLVAELNAQWFRLAVECGVIGEDGDFLISASGGAGGGWTRVRLAHSWDLAGTLGDRPGLAEFLTAATDGDAILGMTSEEYETWLVAKDRVGQWQEETARAAARESPQERAAAWASLLNGPRPTEQLYASWMEGLGGNRAAPEDVLRRLLGRAHHFLWRKQPASVVDAAIAHPDWQVRSRLAESQPDMTADQWTRLVFGEPGHARRLQLAELAAHRQVSLTDAGYERLAGDPSPHARAAAARLPGLPRRLLTLLADDPDSAVRATACAHLWPHLDRPSRDALLTDPDGEVRTAALLKHHEDHPMPRSLFDELDLGPRGIERYAVERAHAEERSVHPDPQWRLALARNPHLEPGLVAQLAEDPDDDVRLAVSLRPDLTEEQRAAVRVDIDPRNFRRGVSWVTDLHDDPEAMRLCAASSHLLVRSGVARAKRLPPDVVERLARDEDRVVRLFLAESCDDAPGWMLLEVWRWWSGSFSFPGRPHGHPNFPRTGLLRYADDPHPRMRLLALDDPDSTAELVERFSRDPDEEVRARAASDPRLSAASAVRLTDDPRSSVRLEAAGNPCLPARTLIGLLRDRERAQVAAGNPALPVSVMHGMIDARESPVTG